MYKRQALDLNIKGDDKYYIAFDYVLDNQDIRNKYRMLKSITDKSEGKIVILDMICFEYLILAFDKLVEWTGTGTVSYTHLLQINIVMNLDFP